MAGELHGTEYPDRGDDNTERVSRERCFQRQSQLLKDQIPVQKTLRYTRLKRQRLPQLHYKGIYTRTPLGP